MTFLHLFFNDGDQGVPWPKMMKSIRPIALGWLEEVCKIRFGHNPYGFLRQKHQPVQSHDRGSYDSGDGENAPRNRRVKHVNLHRELNDVFWDLTFLADTRKQAKQSAAAVNRDVQGYQSRLLSLIVLVYLVSTKYYRLDSIAFNGSQAGCFFHKKVGHHIFFMADICANDPTNHGNDRCICCVGAFGLVRQRMGNHSRFAHIFLAANNESVDRRYRHARAGVSSMCWGKVAS